MTVPSNIRKIRKRDGRIVDFDQNKITEVIYKAAQSVAGTRRKVPEKPLTLWIGRSYTRTSDSDRKLSEKLSDNVVEILNSSADSLPVPGVEDIQDIVEKVLIENGQARIAKAFILYRQKKAEERAVKEAILGKAALSDELKLSVNQVRIAEARYLRKDEQGNLIETPVQMFRRVAHAVASAESNYPRSRYTSKELEGLFYEVISRMEFLPGGRTLANAGTEVNQLANCFVLPVDDSMESIFTALLETALIQKTGGGTGFSFSNLRPSGDIVVKAKGIASGPVSFLHVFDTATGVIKQGGNRRGANMGVLAVNHPDIIEFVTAKEKQELLNNFNLSVAVTDDFMRAVERNEEYELINPRNRQVIKRLNARKVFDLIVTMAWKSGEPGILFIDTINRQNPTPHIGRIEATNPCGEVPLLPYEACNLGSINLSQFVQDGKINYQRLKYVVSLAVRFLDNVIDVSNFPIEKITRGVKANRRIGLGIMGFADMLYQLGIPYDSGHGLKTAEELMSFIRDAAYKTSEEIAREKGVFPNYHGSIFDGKRLMRNCALLSIAPTGTLSMLVEASGGVEPNFALCYMKRVLEGSEFMYINRYFERCAKELGFYSSELMRRISVHGSANDIQEIPEEIRRIFVVAHDISPEWHIRMQAAFQKYVDNSISKTINFSHNATIDDVERAFIMAYQLGCKGVTVYRDGSREGQVLNLGIEQKKTVAVEEVREDSEDVELPRNRVFSNIPMEQPVLSRTIINRDAFATRSQINPLTHCPECNTPLTVSEGCNTCVQCGYSLCQL